MTLNDAALTVGATAMKNAITHLQLHSSGTNPAANAVGARVAASGSVDGDGDITWTGVAFTGLTPGQAVASVSYWTAGSGGTNYGIQTLTGDTTANSAGEFTITSLTETGTST